MRIISGFAKGKRLRTPSADGRGKRSQEIRPTADRAREALFSILGNRVRGAVVLDLFAGTGAMGIEAISRGAKATLFVDNSPVALSLIKENILTAFGGINFRQEQVIRVMQYDLCVCPDFSLLPEELQHFDIIIADPPYSSHDGMRKGLALPTLVMLTSNIMIQKCNPLLIIEERCTITMPTSLNGFIRSDKRIYGEVAFHFYSMSK